MVYTNPATNLSDFFEQRIRWTSKSKGYRDADLLFTALVVAGTSFILAVMLCASVFNGTFFNYYVGLILIKSVADFAMLNAVSKFFKLTQLLWWFIPLQLIYPIYILITVVLGLVGRFEWKNRSFR